MHERYTERARRVLSFARYEATRAGCLSIESEHLLLGLAREREEVSSRILARAQLSLESIWKEIEDRTVYHKKVWTADEIPFGPEMKRALQFAEEEANRLLHNYIGTEHLLLGMLRDECSVGGDMLMTRGLRLRTVREEILVLLSDRLDAPHLVVQIVEGITPQLLSLLRVHPEQLSSLSPEQFEHFVADRLHHMGFTVTLTGATNRKDGGVDIIGAKRDRALGNFLIAAQVKHHRGDRSTGREPIDRILSLKNTLFRFGLVATNTTFTMDAKWVAAQDDNKWFVKLRDFHAMKSWLEDNFTADDTDLPEYVELAPGVRIRIPKSTDLPSCLRLD